MNKTMENKGFKISQYAYHKKSPFCGRLVMGWA